MKTLLASLVALVPSTALYAVDFAISDPANGLFDKTSKVAQTVFTAEWLIKGSAGLFAISCFVAAGNLARQGQYGRAGGAAVGGIIASIGAYLVSLSQG